MNNAFIFGSSGLRKRSGVKERLDTPGIEKNDIMEYFDFIVFTNKYGGGYRTTLKALETVLRSWPENKRVELLDTGCGIGDAAPSILKWGRDRGFSISYKGIDKSSQIIKSAGMRTGGGDIEYSVGDIFDKNLPEADVIIASMVFHHFNEEEMKEALLNLLAKSRRALIINDLTRSFVLYSICYLLTLFVKNKASRNDALLSVRKGFRAEEMREWLDRLRIRGIVKKRFCGRLSTVIFKESGYYAAA